MASLETVSATGEISPRFDKLLKDITADLSQDELVHAVSSIKSNFEGKFRAQGEQDLYSCLHLFANQGLVSEDNLTLLEKFIVTPKTSKKEGIEAKISNFKAIRQQEVTVKEELTGRHSDLNDVMTKLTTDRSSILNLYGSSGVGKTKLATEALSKWTGTKFKVDLREIKDMKDVYFHVLLELSAKSEQKIVSYEANPVIAKMQQVKRESRGDILLLLDNVDQFSGGNVETAGFGTFLERLLGPKTGGEKTKLKILLTSRSEFRHGVTLVVENHEVNALEKAPSGELLQRHGGPSIQGNQRERLVEMCKGKPLLLNGMAAILRQEIADAEKLLGTIEHELESQPQSAEPTPKGHDTQERETFDFKDEGIDEEQMSCLRKMFYFLPSKKLKESAVSVSLFCRPFTVEAAAKILDVDASEAAIQMEGMRNSKVISADTEAKELLYDIHPLMRKFLKSIGSSKAFIKGYQRARDNFYKHFISQMRDISALLDKDYMKAFNSFDFHKLNFELALDISLKSDYLLIPKEHHEIMMICYLFEAMLDEKQRRKIFSSWAEKVEEDGKEGSLFRTEMRCREALQVLNLEGWRRAAEVLKEANESLSTVQKESKKTDFFKLTKSSYLFVEGEIYYRAGNWPKALKLLNRSLKLMEDLLKSHTSTSRCLNAIGNCQNKLGRPEEAIKFYTRAYEMRQELSGSTEHFDMPLFKSQIGTVYEGQKEFRKAIEYYKEALDLAKKLKIKGMLYIALFNRNIANSFCWLREYKNASEFAKEGYEIRKEILGNHPHTARSAFQMAEICRSLEDFDEVEEYYEEAWEIEKSLVQGNHSEVRDRIIESYEEMLRGERKNSFQREVLEFYQRCWDEERGLEGFEFSPANKKIIDSINERLGDVADRQTRKKYENEALWFYEGAWNSTDTEKLPYNVREDILQTLLRLCAKLRKEELYNKYKDDAFRFYEKRWKKSKSEIKPQDRIDILTTLVDLAKSLNYEEKAKKFEELLKESKRGKSFSLLSFLPFGAAAEKFPDDEDDDDASDGDDDDDDDDDVGDDDDEEEEEEEKEEDNSNADDVSEQIPDFGEQNLPQQLHEFQMEEQEDVVEENPDKSKIHEGIVTSEGTHWDLKLGAVHLTFPPGAVSEPTSIVVHRWKCSACSPQLQEHEAVVSRVIEISTNNNEPLEFSTEVKLVLSHSAPDLQGYELMLKRLINKESNEWEDVGETEDLRHLEDIEDDYPSPKDMPDFYFPVVQADITECSTYAVVCRLKLSPPYTITSSGGTFTHPDYPGVTVIIPKKAVSSKARFPLQLKVQEVSSEEFEDNNLFLGPILRIVCSDSIEFLKPVTIQLPVSFQEEQQGIPDASICRVRVLFLRPDGERKEWTEITGDLANPASCDGTSVRFQVERFSGYHYFLDWGEKEFSVSGIVNYLSSIIWSQPRLANFFAYFHPSERLHSQDVLHLICCPADLRKEVIQELERKDITASEASSRKKMIPGRDKAFVFVSGGISPVNTEDMDDFHLMFEGDVQYRSQLLVRLVSDQESSQVDFRSTPESTGRNLLSKLHIRVPTLNIDRTNKPVEFFGVPLNDLLDAPAPEVLGTCRRFVSDETYKGHFHRLTCQPHTQVLRSFFEALAGLDFDVQEKCFETIIKVLRAQSGCVHVAERLQEARRKVIAQLISNNEVTRTVSNRVGALWKRLARQLDLGEGRIDTILEEENDDQERCFKALVRWCQLNGEGATIRKLMLALTKTGLAEVNIDVIRCLHPFS